MRDKNRQHIVCPRLRGFALIVLTVCVSATAAYSDYVPLYDLTGDGTIDFCDEILVASDYFSGNLRSDFNDDGDVDLGDIGLWTSHICSGNAVGATLGSATIGVYFDAAGTITSVDNVPPFTMVDVYLVAKNISSDVGGFSAKVVTPGELLAISDDLMTGTFGGESHNPNQGVFEVGAVEGSCLVPASGTVVLRHFRFLYMGGVDFVLSLQGINVCGLPSANPSWVACGSCVWEYFDTNALSSAVINPRDINGNDIADVFELADIRLIQILGNSSGTGWSMAVRSSNSSFASAENLNFAPVLPAGSPPSDFVGPITGWLQGLGFDAQPWYFDNRVIFVKIPTGSGFELGVDATGVSPLTGGTSCWVASGAPCSFNPTLVDITSSIAGVPEASPLSVTNRPNPFNPSTTIEFSLPEASLVDLVIYDLGGRLVRTLVQDRGFNAGPGSVEWDGRNDEGAGVPTGIYLYRLEAGGSTATGRMALIR